MRIRSIVAIAVLATTSAHAARAQQRFPTTVALAESEGKAHPHAVVDTARTATWARLTGTTDRTCRPAPAADPGGGPMAMRVGGQNAIRAGDFIIGTSILTMHAGRGAKLFWDPHHDPAAPRHDTLTVRSARLDAPAGVVDTARYVEDSHVYPMEGGPGSRVIPHAYYMTSFVLPSAGEWMVVARSGVDWGCVIITVQP